MAKIWKSQNGNHHECGYSQIIQRHENSDMYWTMHKDVKKMFQLLSNESELLNKKFILIHVSSHSHLEERYFFPAEISALEFTLSNGFSRIYHQIVGIAKIYPRGYGGGLRQYSDTYHKISCWDNHPDDYKTILLDLLSFLNGNELNEKDLNEETLDLPYLYTIETEMFSNMMNTKISLENLYKTVFPNHNPEYIKLLFKIGSLERLFNEMINKFNIHLNGHYISPGFSLRDILGSDMYGLGLGCTFHEVRDIAFKCSRSRVLQWMSNICKHLNKYTSLKIIPGRNVALLLRDGSRLIIEDENTPITRQQLGMKPLTEYLINYHQKYYCDDNID
ncbi:protein maelstrom 2-like isoform X2 [Adelges cooleyi]|uniref:protein maelstrom 2-like isoform X2 n=1 Tax=Adelges cooleyi TaxID=133065 RepID=UPI0021803D12|nr:protein maelstrom 2-like isoform X2 [Adelges cooleyi]